MDVGQVGQHAGEMADKSWLGWADELTDRQHCVAKNSASRPRTASLPVRHAARVTSQKK